MKIEMGKDNVIISDFDDVEVLKIAMKIEKDGVKAYNGIANEVDNERLKKTFVRLAEDEKEHLRLFNSLYERLLQGKGVNPDDVDVEEGLFDYMNSEIFKGIEDLGKVSSVGDVIKLGIDVEMRTMLFYTEVYKQISDQKGKQMIKKVIDEEKMHYNILKSWESLCK